MSSTPKPNLHIRAMSLGPVATLDAELSKFSQNLVYARNGTGKSFLTRALRYLDLSKTEQDIQDAPAVLVSEETTNGQGSFELTQGDIKLGKLTLNSVTHQVEAEIGDRIFHVFSDDFVHAELRQTEFVVNGSIESKITLDHSIISTEEAEKKVKDAEALLTSLVADLTQNIKREKDEQLSAKAAINRRLAEFMNIELGEMLKSYQVLPEKPKQSFATILGDLDKLKSIPAEPDYPSEIARPPLSVEMFASIDKNLSRITSPSSVAEEIKNRIARKPVFVEAGVELLNDGDHAHCPFCEQSLEHPPASDLIKSYLAYFADAEGEHRKALRSDWSYVKQLRTAISECSRETMRSVAKYENLRKLVPSLRASALPDVPGFLDQLDQFLIAYAAAIEKKGGDPSSIVVPPSGDANFMATTLETIFDEMRSCFRALRAAISASDTERRNLHREACIAFEVEFVRTNWSSFEEVRLRKGAVQNAEYELAELKKSQLSENARDRVASTFETLITSFFGDRYTFDKSTFTLKRGNREMARGPSRTLSDGEKTVIAFCYFIACVHKKVSKTSEYSRLFMVFDDPITSMSYDYIFAIAQTLKNLSISSTGDVAINPGLINNGYSKPELLVFTHSSYFYNICITNRVVKEDAAFFLHKHGAGHELTNLKKYIAPFEEHLREIVAVDGGADPSHSTGNAIRCVLEAVGRFCHPDKCDSLSNYIIYLATEESFEIKSVLINNLSHGTYYDETPSPDELRDACSEAIRIVEKYAKGQLELARGRVRATHRDTHSGGAR